MKANEMQRYRFTTHIGAAYVVEEPYENGVYVKHSDAMQVIQALEAKIKGMIDRPTIGVVLRDSVYFITINGMECDTDDTPTTYNACKQLVTNYKKALGMEGGAV